MSNIYKVAELAQVSPKTAARILAGESPRSKNRDKVFAAAKQLGYIRNQQAANLRSGTTSVIGIIVPDIQNPFYSKVIQSMHDACLERGFSILPTASFGNPDGETRALRTLQSYQVDGLLFNASELPAGKSSLAICRQLIAQGKPLILSGELARILPGADSLHIHNDRAVAKAVRYLISRGHKRIGFIGGLKESRAMQQRHQGFQLAMDEAGLDPDPAATIFTGGDLSTVVPMVTDLAMGFSTRKRPTAFICGNDIIAISAMKAFQRLSLKIPEDVALIGFDGIDLAELVTPSLTTLHQPQTKIADDITDLLISRIRNQAPAKGRCLSYEPELIIRDST